MNERPGRRRCFIMDHSLLALLIEDDDLILAVLTELLNREGYSTLRAETGSAGLARARSSEPNVVILDLSLPDLSGIVVCERLRRTYVGPIVVLSGDHREETVVAELARKSPGD